MQKETNERRSERILAEMKKRYSGKKVYDLDGRSLHFVCEVEPVDDHPEYDRAIEVIIKSKPHKHLKMTQQYKILKGSLKLYVDDQTIELSEGDQYTVYPEKVHWAEGDECWLEIYSEPGWTKEDHIVVDKYLKK